ncbi:transcriptional regulator [Methanolobus sp. ZRKC3]|uniref:transcriptional regulator n=1 Tax=Methanolobus sp. ZRKC3 TaxID=3125786 RepID=UPI00324DEF6F
MDELIGFVTGNKNRRKLLALLASRNELNGDKLAKNMRIARPSADKVLGELLDRKLVVQNDNSFSLTELGAAVEKRMQSI